MAVVAAVQGTKQPNTAQLCASQSGNGDSTNTVDTGAGTGPVLLKISSVAGTTVTVNIQGSADGTNFFNIPYAVSSTPTTVSVAALTITTTTTVYYYLQANAPWRYLKTVHSANTGMTLSIDAWVF